MACITLPGVRIKAIELPRLRCFRHTAWPCSCALGVWSAIYLEPKMDADRNIALLASLVEAMNLVLVAWAREEAARYGMTLETMAELQNQRR